MNWRVLVLWIIVAAVTIAVFLIPPIPQSENYHHFVDTRTFGGVHNAFDVLSNAIFLIVGLLGIHFVLSDLAAVDSGPRFLDHRERWPYLIFFAGVALTAFGSAYYHLQPDDARLVRDRLPMTLGFMSLLAATLDERISVKTGTRLLVPLLTFGIASVLYWNVTLAHGAGDLRPYVLAQFGSLLVLLLLVALFPPRYTRGADLIVSLLIYALAKVCEAADRPIFNLGSFVSGHTLKHISAAVSAYWILRMLRLRTPINQPVALDSTTGTPYPKNITSPPMSRKPTSRKTLKGFRFMTPAAVERAALADLKRMKRTLQAKIIRRALGMTQEEFAARYRIPLGTLRDWEQGRAVPDQPARAYLTVIARSPREVQQALEN